MADYFIVASGGSQNQLLAMQNEVDKEMYTHGIHAKQVEGNRSSTWILMDYEDVIVHLFSQDDRLFYNLEKSGRMVLFYHRKNLNKFNYLNE